MKDRAKTASFLVPARAQKKKTKSSIDCSTIPMSIQSKVSSVPNSAKKILEEYPVTNEVSSNAAVNNPFEAAIKVLSRAQREKAKTGI